MLKYAKLVTQNLFPALRSYGSAPDATSADAVATALETFAAESSSDQPLANGFRRLAKLVRESA